MRIGQKITLGFTVILVLAAAVGAIAAVSMTDVAGKADSLAKRNVPAVTVATQVERMTLKTMNEIRCWTYADDRGMYDRGMENLAALDKALDDAAKLAHEQHLPTLAEQAETAKKAAGDYRRLIGETLKAEEARDKAIEVRGHAGEAFKKAFHDYVDTQSVRMKAELLAGLPPDKLHERLSKVVIANETIDLGNAIRIAVWKADATRDPSVAEAVVPNFAKIEEKIHALLAITHLEADITELKEAQAAAAAYAVSMKAVLTADRMKKDLAKGRIGAADNVLAAAQAAAKDNTEKSNVAAEDAAVSLARASTILISGLIAMAIIGIISAFSITRGIVTALTRMAADLGACSQQTASAAGQVANAGQALASGTTENAASLEETSASMEEMSSMVRTTSQNTESASAVAQEAKAAGERGSQAMKDLALAISEIKSNADQTAKIIKTIDEIAFQTNLLALNAAVEAARAGDAGKGFAVVAEEVRNLAQRAGQAARTTSELIEKSVKSAESGVKLSTNVTQVVGDMTTATIKVTTLVGEIASSTREISTGIDQVVKAVRQIDQTTQSNAASAEENSAVGEELSAQAASLAELVRALEAMILANPTEPTPPARAPSATRKTMTAERVTHKGLKQPARATAAIPFDDDKKTLDSF